MADVEVRCQRRDAPLQVVVNVVMVDRVTTGRAEHLTYVRALITSTLRDLMAGSPNVPLLAVIGISARRC